jgi:16S rRNA (adenine1518-N6/adenine1519-N6)-dimethyltransferase
MSADRRGSRGQGGDRRNSNRDGHQARKRFGQHFLVDRSVLEAIVQAIAPQATDRMVEIGPGLGALTAQLLMRLNHLSAIEIDRDLSDRLQRRWPASRLSLVRGDVLDLDLSAVLAAGTGGPRARVVGNLPYNISTPLLVRLIEVREHVFDQHFLLQKEVVDRIVAEAGHSDFGRLTVLLQAFYRVEKRFDVGPEAFDPPPRVDSAFLSMTVREVPGTTALEALQQVLAAAFGQRRKMLRGTLLPWLEAKGVDPGDIDGRMRPEDLSVETYCRLADALRSINSIL